MSPDSSLVGRQLDEYRLEELLGHGGMAQVYRGIDVRLNRLVAIKVIDTPFRADADYLMRFEREAQAIARLEHPHSVRLYRYGEADGLLYMAMQYVDGADLGWVRELRSDLSPAIEAVILKAMAQEPEDRYATGSALADALEQARLTFREAKRSFPEGLN